MYNQLDKLFKLIPIIIILIYIPKYRTFQKLCVQNVIHIHVTNQAIFQNNSFFTVDKFFMQNITSERHFKKSQNLQVHIISYSITFITEKHRASKMFVAITNFFIECEKFLTKKCLPAPNNFLVTENQMNHVKY